MQKLMNLLKIFIFVSGVSNKLKSHKKISGNNISGKYTQTAGEIDFVLHFCETCMG